MSYLQKMEGFSMEGLRAWIVSAVFLDAGGGCTLCLE